VSLAESIVVGKSDILMVGVEAELSGLDHVWKVPHRSVHRQELSVERAVFALGGTEFL
jgi:hypothetical protein